MKKKVKKERLVHQTCVRFTPEQWKLVNAYARRQKQDLAEAIRLSVLYFSLPRPKDANDFAKKIPSNKAIRKATT